MTPQWETSSFWVRKKAIRFLESCFNHMGSIHSDMPDNPFARLMTSVAFTVVGSFSGPYWSGIFMVHSGTRTARLIKHSAPFSSRAKASLALLIVQRFDAMACLLWGKRDKILTSTLAEPRLLDHLRLTLRLRLLGIGSSPYKKSKWNQTSLTHNINYKSE